MDENKKPKMGRPIAGTEPLEGAINLRISKRQDEMARAIAARACLTPQEWIRALIDRAILHDMAQKDN